ncbi:MAG TPA: DUF2634 domain-containing protein [Bacillus bacterium]|uniref:DUF2634 domain-containing protein n=1 Tax=Siminovitchia fordii TaxID=254759 RepID=UPI00036AD384|nr:DUF2634 domain-containing protein [Siminovitchia fordii]HBZ09110.1 DUF2634 domain-containing protein [Bacillus sp. (in: firmicutes)]
MADEFAGFDTTGIDIEDDVEDLEIDTVAPKYDPEQACLAVNAIGKVEIGTERDAYHFWVTKCLLTERYKYLGYSTDFGVEIEDIMRSDYPRDIAESEMQRTITEALSIDSRTLSVDNFEFDWSGDGVVITFEIESIFDTEIYQLAKGGEDVGGVAISAA